MPCLCPITATRIRHYSVLIILAILPHRGLSFWGTEGCLATAAREMRADKIKCPAARQNFLFKKKVILYRCSNVGFSVPWIGLLWADIFLSGMRYPEKLSCNHSSKTLCLLVSRWKLSGKFSILIKFLEVGEVKIFGFLCFTHLTLTSVTSMTETLLKFKGPLECVYQHLESKSSSVDA